MPTAADELIAAPDALVDTSVAVPLVLADHEHHRAVTEAVGIRTLGLSGHTAFETFSVLARLPPPSRGSSNIISQGHGF